MKRLTCLAMALITAQLITGCCTRNCSIQEPYQFLSPAKQPLTVTKEGKPAAEIIITKDAPAPIVNAAKEFRHWIKAISGAELPIINAPADMPVKLNFTCAAEILAKYPEDAKKLEGNDGYAVRTEGNTIYLFASQPKGVLNGAFKLLFHNTDIIWARPNVEFGTLFTPNPNIEFKYISHIDIPRFLMRGWQVAYGIGDVEFKWSVRNGANWTSWSTSKVKANDDWGMWKEAYYGHNVIGRYLQPKKYFKDHPEFYAARKGKRIDPHTRNASQLCFSNQEMLKAFIPEYLASVALRPDATMHGICIEDNGICCDCPSCIAPITLPEGKILTVKDNNFYSTRFFMFLNQVAKALKEKYPEKRVSTFAYLFTEEPPAVPIEDNIDVMICPIYKNVKFPVTTPENETTWAKLRGWLKLTQNIIMYEYYGLTKDYPRPVDISAAIDYKYEYENGIKLAHSEICSDNEKRPNTDTWRDRSIACWNCNSMYFWVLTNLDWNPYADVHKLRQEYLKRVFGPAAPDVAKYLTLTEKAWRASTEQSTWNTPSDASWESLAKLNLIPECKEALDRATAKNLSPNSRKMLDRLKLSFTDNDYLKTYQIFQEKYKKWEANKAAYKNLVINGNFETAKDKVSMQEKDLFDWEGTQVDKWSFWRMSPNGKYGIAAKQGINGSNCVFIDGTPSSCFIQAFPATEGQIYLIKCKTKHQLDKDSSYLFIRWSKKNGAWLNKGDKMFYSSRPGKDGWRDVTAVIAVPKDAVKLHILAGTPGCEGKILLDNVEAFLLK